MNTTSASRNIKEFNFKELFLKDLNWDRFRAQPIKITANGNDYTLAPVAEKRGFQVFECVPSPSGDIPDRAARMKIERGLSKLAAEHLIVFVNKARTMQMWQWARREPGRPLAVRTETFEQGGTGERLLQKLNALYVSFEEEENLFVTGVSGQVRQGFDVDRIAKRFYDKFKTEHAAFLKFIKGIQSQGDGEWYASLMLNRLMFIYFVQKKGFLDGDDDYLRNRLRRMQEIKGRDKFLSFYRYFLLRLFHEGLGGQSRDTEHDALLGRVPYLNGGLFDVHELERDNKNIQIEDQAFERIFNFFDEYQWHLDDRPLRDDHEINPDVLGYIFEKYINQKQMGAYYTKEDITEYISKNTVIPFIFDQARKDCRIAFRPESAVWRLLKENPDRYIYAAVRQGVVKEDGSVLPLPPEIEAGVRDVSRRGGWNRAADVEYALPTETWREHVARRTRCLDLRRKLAAGEVHEINDLITLNLDIRQFAQDVIDNCEGVELLRAIYTALERVTVLDPTCGSGAFLFAALNVLEPMYEACLKRMQEFVDDLDASSEKHRPEKFSDLRKTLERLKQRNRRYFILKSIIIGNLYGVDIMEEATEICKLRLFLKLVAQLERPEDIEPLPDIDFNIRAGNTLVGFATYDEVKKAIDGALQGKFDYDNNAARIEESAEIAARAFERFREMQTEYGMDAGEFHTAKEELRRLDVLGEELDRYFAGEYGVDADKPSAYKMWRESHQPFHWFVEFYEIIKRGGFDVIIGNPPYISAAKVRREYSIKNYQTITCSDIYANVLERCGNILLQNGRFGMIVPLSLTFSGDFDNLRKLLYERYSTNWFSSFARIPAALFSADVRVRNTIHLGHKSKSPLQAHSTVLHRWFEQARPQLFSNLSYADFSPAQYNGLVPKTNTTLLAKSLEQSSTQTKKRLASCFAHKETKHVLHFKKSAYNWLCFCRELPPCFDRNGRPIAHTKFGSVYFTSAEIRDLAFLFLNGKIMFAYWCMIGDDLDVTRWMFADFPIDLCTLPHHTQQKLLALTNGLEELMIENTSFKLNAGKKVGNYNLAKCRAVTDVSDKIFAQHLGLGEGWHDVELIYAQLVRTSFSVNESDD